MKLPLEQIYFLPKLEFNRRTRTELETALEKILSYYGHSGDRFVQFLEINYTALCATEALNVLSEIELSKEDIQNLAIEELPKENRDI